MNSLFTSVLEISWQAGLIALAVMAVLEAAVRSSETGSTQTLELTAEERSLLR